MLDAGQISSAKLGIQMALRSLRFSMAHQPLERVRRLFTIRWGQRRVCRQVGKSFANGHSLCLPQGQVSYDLEQFFGVLVGQHYEALATLRDSKASGVQQEVLCGIFSGPQRTHQAVEELSALNGSEAGNIFDDQPSRLQDGNEPKIALHQLAPRVVRPSLMIVDAVRLARRAAHQNIHVTALNAGITEHIAWFFFEEIVVKRPFARKGSCIGGHGRFIGIHAAHDIQTCEFGPQRDSAEAAKAVKNGSPVHGDFVPPLAPAGKRGEFEAASWTAHGTRR
ncbi:MAG: hypothetical protein NTW03_07510 [Verrucomicrobia bacterium]|nr:hypothetical protein [Verrucomicrobiota bacterium]